MNAHAVEVSMLRSRSLASLRQRPSQAKVRSMDTVNGHGAPAPSAGPTVLPLS